VCDGTARMIYAASISPAAPSAVAAAQALRPANATGSGRRDPPSRRRDAKHRFGPVKPSRTQSCLVVPSQTLNFSLPRGASMRVTHSIRGICVIRGRNFFSSVPIRVHLWLPPSQSSLTTSHWPLATTAVKPSQTQSNLVKPSPTFNSPGRGAIVVVRVCPDPTQYDLIRPNTALNVPGRVGAGQKTPMEADGRGSERRGLHGVTAYPLQTPVSCANAI
jgi:hypothetical protein